MQNAQTAQTWEHTFPTTLVSWLEQPCNVLITDMIQLPAIHEHY